MFENENAGPDLSDPKTLKSDQELIDHLGKARSLLLDLKGNADGRERAIADLKKQLQGIQEAAAAPQQRSVNADASDRDLVTRYVGGDGRLNLKTVKREVSFGGRSAMVEQRGLLDDTDAVSPWHLELQELCTRRSMVRLFAKNRETPDTDAQILRLMSRAPQAIRGMLEKAISDSAGSGAEWIPDGTFPTLYEEFRTPNRLASLFGTVNMPRATMTQPKLATGARPYKRNSISSDDPASYTGSTPVSSDESLTVTDWSVRVVYDEMDGEDAVIVMESLIRRIVSDALNDGYEDTMINGDTAGTHQDAIASWNIRSRWGATGLGGAADHRRIFLGLRALAYDRSNTVDMGTNQTVAAILGTLIGGMGERAASDLVAIPSIEVFYRKMLTDSNVITLDKLGAGATLLTGQLASIGGHPVIPSRWVSADQAATGLYTGSGALSSVIAADRTAFQHFQRRSVTVEMERQIVNGSVQVVATLRRLFKTLSGSSEPVARVGFNWLS